MLTISTFFFFLETQEPTTKHQKTEPTPNRSQFAIPHPPSTLNGDNHQSLRWRCTTCLYGGNEADDLVCGICRNEPADDVAMVSATAMVSEMTPATVPPTLDLSMPSRFVVPSTLTTEILQQQQKAGDGLNQDTTMRMMVTALTAEDDVSRYQDTKTGTIPLWTTLLTLLSLFFY